MKTDFIKLNQKNASVEKRKKKNYTSAATFLVCIVLALFSWLLIVLAKEYSYRINIPVRFENLPEGKVSLLPLPGKISVQINATGFSILSLVSGLRRSSAILDLASVESTPGTSSENNFKIPSSLFMLSLQNQLGTDIFIEKVFPDTFRMNYSLRFFRKVPVHAKIQVSLAENCDYSGTIQVIPDSVMIFGAEEDLRKVSFIETQNIRSAAVDRTINTISYLDTGMVFSAQPSRVRVKIPVEKYTGQETEVAVHPVNNVPAAVTRFIPSKVKIAYLVSHEGFRKMTEKEFTVEAEIPKDPEQASGFAKVKVVRFPDGIKNVRTEPSEVEYILLKK